ncbi:MAG: hypothetical protein ABJB12_23100, partial [Pseudomonadota bacterium]
MKPVWFWFAAGCLVWVGCTRLKDPNDVFGDAQLAGVAGLSGAANGGELVSVAGAAGENAMGGYTQAASGGAPGSEAGSLGEAGAPSISCDDPSGFHGLGCGVCAATDIFSLENACTGAVCTRFDNSLRLTKLGPGGALPSLPAAAGGAGGA